WTCLTSGDGVRALFLHKAGAPAEEHTREAYQERDGQHIGSARVPQTTSLGSVAKFDFWGKIQKSGIRNSMAYRLPKSRKSNFATYMDPPTMSRGTREEEHV